MPRSVELLPVADFVNLGIAHLPNEGTMTIMVIDKRGRGTFPDEVRKDLGLDEDGTLVLLEKTARGTYELIPAAVVPKDQLWFHHAETQARIAEAEADIREGRFTAAATPEEAQAYLDSLKR
jgi:bifunctional DNA-binding transcriptional regulator/antitoxin component of YhaV-PrlF toxin-antitoxin module